MRIERINGDIPALACSFSDGALRAQMGYNMATAIITLIAPDAELAQRGGPDSCEINLINNNGGDATLRFVYASRVDAAAPEARLTTDYDLTIARDTAALARTEFAEEIAAGDFNWFAARNSNPAHDWDDDGIANPYDWTPTSITIMVDGAEVEVGVNLTVHGVDPWPIYNVWQLQAIDGLSVSDAGVTTAGFELFGDDADSFGGELSFGGEYRRDADGELAIGNRLRSNRRHIHRLVGRRRARDSRPAHKQIR